MDTKIRNLEKELRYQIDPHLGKLQHKCKLLIGEKHDPEISDKASITLDNLMHSRTHIPEMIDKALGNSEEDPLDYLKGTIFALEQEVYELYAMINFEQDLDFLKEY